MTPELVLGTLKLDPVLQINLQRMLGGSTGNLRLYDILSFQTFYFLTLKEAKQCTHEHFMRLYHTHALFPPQIESSN